MAALFYPLSHLRPTPAGVEIQGSGHAPPGAHLVAELIEDMCDYVNDRWHDATAIHTVIYKMAGGQSPL
jgi:hypothetical protein